jgi:N-acetyl-gamma-glutamyl-phosphate reductase
LALPHRVSMEIAPKFLKLKKKVIDLSADYRLEDLKVYKKWYGVSHKDEGNLKEAVYGLPEAYRSSIKGARLIANPGCYPTASLLALLPIVKQRAGQLEYLIIDAKTGVTGAGRKPDISISFAEVDENLKAYKINEHQHAPEIAQELSKLGGGIPELVFVPHLAPMRRGILATIYIKLAGELGEKEIFDLYEKSYKKEPFVRVMGKGTYPEIKNVVGTNFCDIGIKVDKTKRLVIIVSAIDNLDKGASGQAVQNMNIMCGFDERAGLL